MVIDALRNDQDPHSYNSPARIREGRVCVKLRNAPEKHWGSHNYSAALPCSVRHSYIVQLNGLEAHSK